jgi:hypothetical protein
MEICISMYIFSSDSGIIFQVILCASLPIPLKLHAEGSFVFFVCLSFLILQLFPSLNFLVFTCCTLNVCRVNVESKR